MTELAKVDKSEIIYEVAGEDIKLSPSIVQQFIAKGQANVTYEEAINFMMLCKHAELNPFLNDAYLIKYSTNQPAQMVVSKEALMKRANRQPDYQGLTSGIVVTTKDGEVRHKKGQLLYPGEQLIGGWAEVKRKDFVEPVYAEVGYQEYDTGKSMWKKMPANMINKVAEATALRKAYPDQLGQMYVAEEEQAHKIINSNTDNQGDPLEFEHSEDVGEPTVTAEERIKEIKKEIKLLDKQLNTYAKVDDAVAEKYGLEDITIIKDEVMVGYYNNFANCLKAKQAKEVEVIEG